MEDDTDDKNYTLEQRIVSAVWIHERTFNSQTLEDIQQNFRARFKMTSPSRATLFRWEKKLFTTGDLNNAIPTGRPCARLMHIPYVKASLEEYPNLSMRERAKTLGLPQSTLHKILKEDLNMTFEAAKYNDPHPDEPKRLKRPCFNGGQWKINDGTQTPTEEEGITVIKEELEELSDEFVE